MAKAILTQDSPDTLDWNDTHNAGGEWSGFSIIHRKSTIQPLRQKKVIRHWGMNNTGGRLERLAAALMKGYSGRVAAHIVASNSRNATKFRNVLEARLGKPILCGCGDLAVHTGWCSFRKKPEYQVLYQELYRRRKASQSEEIKQRNEMMKIWRAVEKDRQREQDALNAFEEECVRTFFRCPCGGYEGHLGRCRATASSEELEQMRATAKRNRGAFVQSLKDKVTGFVAGTYTDPQHEAIAKALEQGLSNRAIARFANIDKTDRGIKRMRVAMEAKRGSPYMCPCGQVATHRCSCSFRFSITPPEKRERMLAGLAAGRVARH